MTWQITYGSIGRGYCHGSCIRRNSCQLDATPMNRALPATTGVGKVEPIENGIGCSRRNNLISAKTWKKQKYLGGRTRIRKSDWSGAGRTPNDASTDTGMHSEMTSHDASRIVSSAKLYHSSREEISESE